MDGGAAAGDNAEVDSTIDEARAKRKAHAPLKLRATAAVSPSWPCLTRPVALAPFHRETVSFLGQGVRRLLKVTVPKIND
jgi:hypothetical protein